MSKRRNNDAAFKARVALDARRVSEPTASQVEATANLRAGSAALVVSPCPEA